MRKVQEEIRSYIKEEKHLQKNSWKQPFTKVVNKDWFDEIFFHFVYPSF